MAKLSFKWFFIIILAVLMLSGKGLFCKESLSHASEVKLIMATHVMPAYKDLWPSFQGFVDYVNEHGKGIVQIDFHHSGTLLKYRGLLPGLQAGTADLAFLHCSGIFTTYPILGIWELPFLNRHPDDIYKHVKIDSSLYKLMNQELAKKDLFIIAPGPLPVQNLWTTKKPVRTPADMKGLKIRTAGKIEAKTLEALGCAATSISSAELYMALQRGTVGGALCYPGTVHSRTLDEVLKYVTAANFGTYQMFIGCRRSFWNGLSQEARDVLIEAGKWYERDITVKCAKYIDEKYWPKFRKNLKIIELTAQEREGFQAKCGSLYDWWVDQVGTDVGKKALELIRAK